MRITVDLPDDLIHEIRTLAARDSRKLKDLMAELLRRGLASDREPHVIRHRVKLPIIETKHPAAPGEELTPDRLKDILLEQYVQHYFQAIGQVPPEPPYDNP